MGMEAATVQGHPPEGNASSWGLRSTPPPRGTCTQLGSQVLPAPEEMSRVSKA